MFLTKYPARRFERSRDLRPWLRGKRCVPLFRTDANIGNEPRAFDLLEGDHRHERGIDTVIRHSCAERAGAVSRIISTFP